MSSSKPLVYFIVGTPASGRRGIVRDLIQNGLAEEQKVLVLLAENEKPAESDAALAKLKNAAVARWEWTPAPAHSIEPAELPAVDFAGADTIFFIADSRVSPMDQIEALKPWLISQDAELARIFCTVDCQLAEKNPALRQWFDACIHFADAVFLANREGVANKWLSDFIAHYKDQSFPCHFVYVKKGDLTNPALLLDPTPRRISQYFEEGEIYEIEGLETDDDEEDLDEEDTGLLPPEPYFVRQRSGRREKEVPDIRDYLAK
ncbi:hypothetical protein [Oleiharenicola lentus]|uniref:hypothetical protein n=1 Tax=Oleiharenicola lentus TaxID=2508720 RepID=UPI003F675DF1